LPAVRGHPCPHQELSFTGSQKHRDPRYSPYAFTEHGTVMAANVLNSKQAVQMSVFVVRWIETQNCGLLPARGSAV
jgi:hypothetical protein